jgi:hypothetical protein
LILNEDELNKRKIATLATFFAAWRGGTPAIKGDSRQIDTEVSMKECENLLCQVTPKLFDAYFRSGEI